MQGSGLVVSRPAAMAIAVAAMFLAVACGSDDATDETASATVPPPSVVTLGDKVELDEGGTVRVFSYRAGERPEGGTHDESKTFSVIDVEGCAPDDAAARLNASQFRLIMRDNSRVAPTFAVVKEPRLPAVIAAGDCVRGLVTYEVSPGATPAAVSYVAAGTNLRWRVT